MDDKKIRRLSLGISLATHLVFIGSGAWIFTSQPTSLLAPPIELHLQAAATPHGPNLAQSLGEILQSTTSKPRSKTISSADHGTSLEAYLLAWQTKVEMIGNQYYLSAEQRFKHQGELRVLVSLTKDGHVKSCQIRQSNGDKHLEAMVQTIMAKAGSFGPIPEELHGSIDELEIIKTWSFKGGFGLKER